VSDENEDEVGVVPPSDMPVDLRARFEALPPSGQVEVGSYFYTGRWDTISLMVEALARIRVDRYEQVIENVQDMTFYHLAWTLLPAVLRDSEFFRLIVDPELIPLLTLDPDLGLGFLDERRRLIDALVGRAIENPMLMKKWACSLYPLWFASAAHEIEPLFVINHAQLMSITLADLLSRIGFRLFGYRAIPIGIDHDGGFSSSPLRVVSHQNLWALYRHLAVAWAIPGHGMSVLWKQGDILADCADVERGDDAFPNVERPLEVGTELLTSAYGSKAYTIAQPSEVLLNVGEIKSVTLVEEQGERYTTYKVRYRDDSVSFGQVGLRETEANHGGELLVTEYSTREVTKILLGTGIRELRRQGAAMAAAYAGSEYAFVAALVRDFMVCEERERYYTATPLRRTRRTSQAAEHIVVRYLPRFKVHYIGLREGEFRERKSEVVGHHVSGHLRRCRMASPSQIALAGEFSVTVPEGFTFVQPHNRGAHTRVLYRSRSAVELVYGYAGGVGALPDAPLTRTD